MPIRVVHCYRTFFPDTQGGGEEAIRQIMLSTGRLGIENTMFTLSSNPNPVELLRPEARVVRGLSWAAPASCDLGTLNGMRLFRRLVRSADIVHYHFPWPFADVLQHLCVRDSKPKLMTYHSDIVRQRLLGTVYWPLMSSMLGSMDEVVATSEAYARSSIVLREKVSPDKLAVIPLGICEESYGAAVAAAKGISLKDRFGLEAGKYFLSLGVLRYYKGLHTLIESAKSVKSPIVLAGDGPMRSALEAASSQLPSGDVRLVGRVTDAEKMALIAGCRAFVLPSHLRSEAFGMVLVEAAMSGRPMISCEIGTGTSFVNSHDETGIVIAPENPAALSAAMNALIDNDELVGRFGRNARLRYEKLFSGAALGNAYRASYSRLLDSGTSRKKTTASARALEI